MKRLTGLQFLRLSAGAAAITFVLLAVFAPFHETGTAIYVSPVIGICLAALYVAFVFGMRWSWDWVFYYSVIGVVINLAFLPTAEHYGPYLWIAYVLTAIEVGSCALTFLLMLGKGTKQQFLSTSSQGSK